MESCVTSISILGNFIISAGIKCIILAKFTYLILAFRLEFRISEFQIWLELRLRFRNFGKSEIFQFRGHLYLQANSIIDNIANKFSFLLRMLGSPKYNEKTGEHVREKKAIQPKDGTIFDFMIRPPNDKSEVVKVLF